MIARDSSRLEYTAEDLIAHKLQRAGLFLAKPKFDIDGADLLAMLHVKDNAKFCRIQCKGRTIKAGSSAKIEIPVQYVTDGFVLFVYLETGNLDETKLFCLMGRDIKDRWKLSKGKFRLSLAASTYAAKLGKFQFAPHHINLIKEAILRLNVNGEFSILNGGGANVKLPALTGSGDNWNK